MTAAEGGCLCGRVRYAVAAPPDRVTVCHCRFCQRATGGAYMVEPIFAASGLTVTAGAPRTYDHRSEGSGKIVHIHFCADCGTKLWLSFERFPDSVGVYAGTFDDPDWFPIRPEAAKHIYLGMARPDTVIPAGLPCYTEHATTLDGTAQPARVFDAPHPMTHDR
ncbi:MAG: GFA family protein [Gemmobacter sp.]